MNIKIFVVLIFLLLIDFAQQSPHELSINVEDILSEKLMPVSMLMLEGRQSDQFNNRTDLSELIPIENVGKFQNAYATMDFHRQVISQLSKMD